MRTTAQLYFKSMMCNQFKRSLRQDTDASQVYTQSFRVPLLSIDMNGHMTNSRYHTCMDYVHVSFMMDTGIWEYAFNNQANPVVSSAFIRFRRSLHWGDPFEVQFRLISIHGGYFFSEIQFIKDDFVYCQALRKFSVHKKGQGMIAAERVLTDLDQPLVSQDLPDYMDLWQTAELSFKKQALSPGLSE